MLPRLPLLGLCHPPPFSLVLGTPGPMHQLLAQLLAHDNQMSFSHGPSEQPEPSVCLSALQGNTGPGSAQLHRATGLADPAIPIQRLSFMKREAAG